MDGPSPLIAGSAPPPRPARKRRWGRWLALAALTYLALWGATWVFGRSAVVRYFVACWGTTTDRAGNRIPVDVRTGSKFTGRGLQFFPDPMPERAPWCCVGEPTVPAPFVVSVQAAAVDGPLSGGAGQVVFIWTPWDVYPVYEKKQWVAYL